MHVDYIDLKTFNLFNLIQSYPNGHYKHIFPELTIKCLKNITFLRKILMNCDTC